jgi:hypothetical protein
MKSIYLKIATTCLFVLILVAFTGMSRRAKTVNNACDLLNQEEITSALEDKNFIRRNFETGSGTASMTSCRYQPKAKDAKRSIFLLLRRDNAGKDIQIEFNNYKEILTDQLGEDLIVEDSTNPAVKLGWNPVKKQFVGFAPRSMVVVGVEGIEDARVKDATRQLMLLAIARVL